MSRTHSPRRQRGAALVVGLILLAIITLLAVVGMNMSNSELQSATSEQLRLRAFQAAETGIERALPQLYNVPTAKGTIINDPVTAVEGSTLNPSTGLPQDSYQTSRMYVDESSMAQGASAGKIHAFHFAVTSTGTSARNASAQIVQGAYILATVQ